MPSASGMTDRRAQRADQGLLMWVRAEADRVAEQFRHTGPRTAASINLAALLMVAIGASLWQPSFRMQRAPAPSAALAPAPRAVTIIGASPRGADCRDQTWPYIDRHCLNYGPPQTATAAPAAQTSGNAPAINPDLREPVAAAAPVQPAPPAPVQPATQSRVPYGHAQAPSTDDVSIADDPEELGPSEEELRAQAQAEARQRRRIRHRDTFGRHGHFWIGPFRF